MQTVNIQTGTTLFHVAAAYLDDATQWFRIALINQIRDPFISQPITLLLPTIHIEQRQGSGTQP
jgi:hypothetical protein